MIKLLFRVVGLMILLFGGQSKGQAITPAQKATLDKLFEKQVEGIAPGLAVGILKNGDIIYENYIGYANLEHEVKIDANTRFNIASNAKQFTALCVLTLVNDGEIDLQDDIRKYLPELFKEVKEKITIEHLITHSSGIRDIYALWGLQGKTWWAEEGLSNGDAFKLLLKQKKLNFSPGSQYLYSNSNYLLMTEIVKRVSGTEFAEYARSIFKKLQMVESRFNVFYMEVVPHKARPYGNWGQWTEYPVITDLHGDGALFTSLRDQLIWERMVQLNQAGQLVNPLISQSQKPVSESKIQSYGYGLEFGEYKGLKTRFHDGSTGAYNASFTRFPEEGLSIVVMSNSGKVSARNLVNQAADIIIDKGKLVEPTYGELPEVSNKKFDLDKVTGNYKRTDGTYLRVVEDGGELYWSIYQSNRLKLVHEKGNQYALEADPMVKIIFSKGEGKNILFTVYYPGSEPRVHSRLPSEKLDEAYFKSLEGRYFNDETGGDFVFKSSKEQMYAVTSQAWDDWEGEGTLWYKDVIRMESYYLRVTRNSKGQVNGFLLSNDRLKRVEFLKMN